MLSINVEPVCEVESLLSTRRGACRRTEEHLINSEAFSKSVSWKAEVVLTLLLVNHFLSHCPAQTLTDEAQSM